MTDFDTGPSPLRPATAPGEDRNSDWARADFAVGAAAAPSHRFGRGLQHDYI
ncbi:hypothetical protein [Micromonospora haikouensis]|uniref:hypothetical protein n=1 Tax=Micromonospora haikouensis TaxID=686309 RepID=UPI0033EC7258